MRRDIIEETVIGSKPVEAVGLKQMVKGQWRDQIFKKENEVEELIEDNDWEDNMVVVSGTELMAGLLKNEGSFSGGILYHAVGEGLIAWDTVLVQPSFSDRYLEDELARLTPDDIYYLDGSDLPTATITSRVEIKTTFDYASPINGHFIREQGVVGGDATAVVNTGFFFDIIRHKGIYKDSSVKIVRYIRLTF